MSSKLFNKVQVSKPNFSKFDMSYNKKISMKMGKLVPVHCQEVIPGDVFNQSTEAMLRFQPMIAPIMHKVDVFFHTFFVPNRILWPNWEKFIVGPTDDDISYVAPSLPKIRLSDVAAGSLKDYMGLPVNIPPGGSPTGNFENVTVNALPFAAYQRIFHEYYRDQNMQNPKDNPIFEKRYLEDGLQTTTPGYLWLLQDRAWEHDYFTSCLPYAQKGAPVQMPIDLSGIAINAAVPQGFNPLFRRSDTGAPANYTGQAVKVNNFGSSTIYDSSAGDRGVYYDPQGTLQLSGQANSTIEDLRNSVALQKWLELNARAGNRYDESVFAHFGVRPQDARLQRPEYLGGSKSSMAISEVLQTSSTDSETPQGNMAGHGIAVSAGNNFRYRVQEHGYVITICSVLPKTSYFQGIPRHFSQESRFDYFWPLFAQLGEEPVYNKELMVKGNQADNAVFGYLPRYAHYRYNNSGVAGEMATNLDFWHMARKFDTSGPHPTLNDEFIRANPTKRIFAVEDGDTDELLMHVHHRISARRPIPFYSTPGRMTI